MAKTKDLAALAALGMLGYKMSQNKGNKDDAGDQNDTLANVNRVSKMSEDSDTLARMNREKTPGQGAVDDANAGVLNALSAPKVAPNDKAPNQGVLGGSTPPPKPKRTGMTHTQNTALANANQQAKLEAESDALAKANQKAKTTTVVKPTPPATTTPTSSAKPLPANKSAPPVTTSSNRVPTPEQAAANRQALYDKVKGFGSSVVDAVTNFETPPERAARERKAALGKKRGGAVKKMASGGMTSKVSSASSRADGIASRGKTRCKMY